MADNRRDRRQAVSFLEGFREKRDAAKQSGNDERLQALRQRKQEAVSTVGEQRAQAALGGGAASTRGDVHKNWVPSVDGSVNVAADKKGDRFVGNSYTQQGAFLTDKSRKTANKLLSKGWSTEAPKSGRYNTRIEQLSHQSMEGLNVLNRGAGVGSPGQPSTTGFTFYKAFEKKKQEKASGGGATTEQGSEASSVPSPAPAPQVASFDPMDFAAPAPAPASETYASVAEHQPEPTASEVETESDSRAPLYESWLAAGSGVNYGPQDPTTPYWEESARVPAAGTNRLAASGEFRQGVLDRLQGKEEASDDPASGDDQDWYEKIWNQSLTTV